MHNIKLIKQYYILIQIFILIFCQNYSFAKDTSDLLIGLCGIWEASFSHKDPCMFSDEMKINKIDDRFVSKILLDGRVIWKDNIDPRYPSCGMHTNIMQIKKISNDSIFITKFSWDTEKNYLMNSPSLGNYYPYPNSYLCYYDNALDKTFLWNLSPLFIGTMDFVDSKLSLIEYSSPKGKYNHSNFKNYTYIYELEKPDILTFKYDYYGLLASYKRTNIDLDILFLNAMNKEKSFFKRQQYEKLIKKKTILKNSIMELFAESPGEKDILWTNISNKFDKKYPNLSQETLSNNYEKFIDIIKKLNVNYKDKDSHVNIIAALNYLPLKLYILKVKDTKKTSNSKNNIMVEFATLSFENFLEGQPLYINGFINLQKSVFWVDKNQNGEFEPHYIKESFVSDKFDSNIIYWRKMSYKRNNTSDSFENFDDDMKWNISNDTLTEYRLKNDSNSNFEWIKINEYKFDKK